MLTDIQQGHDRGQSPFDGRYVEAVDDSSSVSLRNDESGVFQYFEVSGQRRTGQIEAITDIARGQVTRLEQFKYPTPRRVTECVEDVIHSILVFRQLAKYLRGSRWIFNSSDGAGHPDRFAVFSKGPTVVPIRLVRLRAGLDDSTGGLSWKKRNSMSPLLILIIGIAVVLGLIIVCRINAFLALITAALVVSLMAPGEIGSRVDRVASAFGAMAGNIGIVIALAAVIGQCMMSSGAADRIVRAFLSVLGEKRAPAALMGSGFVLAVPVFFDTVFYLLVPLARSLHQKTRKHYLLYVLAISAGGAITHTLVPPTPGPLLMAATLGIDVGLMILVGAMVALPAAVAGIAFSRFLDNRMSVPMRSTTGEERREPVPDAEMPSLLSSLLPIVLPVLMISANTIVTTMADGQHAGRLSVDDVPDWAEFSRRLSDSTVGRYVNEELVRLGRRPLTDPADAAQTQDTVAALNRVLEDRHFYQPAAFESVLIPRWKAAAVTDGAALETAKRTLEFYQLQASLGPRTKPVVVERMNRLLLEIAFPDVIRPHQWNTGLRRASRWTALFGNANFSLLLSAAIALSVYVRHRRPSKAELSRSVEAALMSGGAIILITAAGGAFGKMLDVAGVGDAIKTGFSSQSADGGTAFLLLGFAIAAVFKVAQGSSTTAMIVVAGMLAPLVSNAALPFNAVYLATAIGAGSLVGSWMNDSGFWIFAKMSGLTETEALKSWTPLLLVLAGVSLAMTLLLARVLPLV